MPAIRPVAPRLGISLAFLLVAGPGYAAGPKPAQPVIDWSHAQPVTVVMVDDRFQPDHVSFEQGQAYDLHLENHGKEMHEFTASAFLKAATIRDETKLANGGTDIVVQPGETVDVFLVAPAAGNYNLICADHDWDGMTGSITVGSK
jgi:uncharacterized cupredoxin-like copper-binding protein